MDESTQAQTGIAEAALTVTSEPASEAASVRGYGRPPVSGQFKPGRSGNPKGRPKKRPLPPQSLYERELTKMTLIKLPDGRQELTMNAQIIAMRDVQKAMKGDDKVLQRCKDECPELFKKPPMKEKEANERFAKWVADIINNMSDSAAMEFRAALVEANRQSEATYNKAREELRESRVNPVIRKKR